MWVEDGREPVAHNLRKNVARSTQAPLGRDRAGPREACETWAAIWPRSPGAHRVRKKVPGGHALLWRREEVGRLGRRGQGVSAGIWLMRAARPDSSRRSVGRTVW